MKRAIEITKAQDGISPLTLSTFKYQEQAGIIMLLMREKGRRSNLDLEQGTPGAAVVDALRSIQKVIDRSESSSEVEGRDEISQYVEIVRDNLLPAMQETIA